MRIRYTDSLIEELETLESPQTSILNGTGLLSHGLVPVSEHEKSLIAMATLNAKDLFTDKYGSR